MFSPEITTDNARYGWKIPPTLLLTILFILISAISGSTLFKITHQPWMGVTFDVRNDIKQGILVKSIKENSPASSAFKVGDRLMSISSSQHTSGHPLSINLLQPPLSLRTISEYKSAISQHEKIANILQSEKVYFLTQDGRKLTITPHKNFPVSSIPFPTVFFFLSNLIGIIIGTVVWLRYPGKEIGIYLFLMGIGYYGHSTGSLLIVKELSLPHLHLISSFENFFSLLFGVSLITAIIHYPNKIYSLWYMLPLTTISLTLWVNATLMITDAPFHTFFFQFILFYPFFFYFSYKQWESSKADPLQRAAYSVFLLFTNMFVITAVTLFIVPMVFSLPTIFEADSAKLLMGSIFIGFAIGIFKYRLFNVEKWWFKVWLWFFSGMLIILMDLILVYTLHLNQLTALGLSIIFIGFIYFPFRQWLFQRLLPTSEKPVQNYIPHFMQTISDNLSSQGFEDSWLKVLQDRYHPLHIEHHPQSNDFALINNGMLLIIPDSQHQGHYQLTGKNSGTRLFNEKDCSDVDALHKLMQLIDQTSQKHHELRLQERKVIMGDLHDTVGANLLTLAHRQKDPQQADYIHSTLQTLRETIRLSTSDEKHTLESSLADWRAEARERCELVNIDLRWNSEALNASSITLNVIQIITLTQVIREAITNAIKHAQPSYIDVTISELNQQIEMIVRNDGDIAEKSSWQEGMGLQNMRSRMTKQKGELEIVIQEEQVFLMATLPIQ